MFAHDWRTRKRPTLATFLAAKRVIGERNRVYLQGDVPKDFVGELAARDLIPIACDSIDHFADKAADPLCRVAIYVTNVPNDDQAEQQALLKLLGTITPTFIQNGVMMVIAVSGDDGDAARTHWSFVTSAADAAATDLGLVDPKRFRPRVVGLTELTAAYAQECLRHDPGRAWRDIPVIDDCAAAPPEEALELNRALATCPEDKRLLQRAFGDYGRIDVRLRQIRGEGARARRVYEVRPHDADRPEVMPFLVKTAAAEACERELGAAEIACGDHTPFVHFPPLVHDRHVTGHRRAALVSHFIERAILLETYIATHSPAVAIASLFDGPLRAWRSHSHLDLISLGEDAYEKGYVGFKAVLYWNAYKKAQRVKPDVRKPGVLLNALRTKPPMEVRVCRSHGDLHLRNVFVRENSVDVMLIDFNRAGQAPASRDPAELEVSLAFSPPKVGNIGLSDEDITRLYEPPLLCRPDLPRRSHPRALAIDQVRRQIAGTVGEDEYRVMIGAHCLYYARRRNVRAYLAADGLL